MPKYHILTYGCQMNKSDSERIAAGLKRKGYKPASKIKEADLIVVNMCSVRQSAVDRIYGLIEKFKKLEAKTILTGCILPTDKKKFLNKFNSILSTKDLLKQYHGLVCSTVYVPISNGCNNFCAYCVVPLTRGRLACRPHQEILKELKNAVKKGAREIWLLGQNVNDYKSHTINFAKLLKLANDIPGNFSIRFMSPHPANFNDELIETMAESPKIAKYLNLPVQSGDDAILKKMNRNYTAQRYAALVEKIREKMPNINLSTDAIVGFPGETAKQFENTAELFKRMNFDIAYVAKYSPRPGTAAFKLKDNVSLEEKKRRAKILTKLTKHPS